MKNKVILFFILSTVGMSKVFADPPDEGKTIFISRCAGCHSVDKALTGPALSGVDTRHSTDWIINFVHSSQTVIKAGDKEAMALYTRFNRVTMPDHQDLTADNIKSIISYIKSVPALPVTTAPFAKPGHLQTQYLPLSFQKDYWLFIIYLGAVILLVMVLLFAVRMKSFRSNQSEERVLR